MPEFPADRDRSHANRLNADAQVGRVLGHRYRLLAHIGSGSSAHVFKAEDLSLDRQVAVKCLRSNLSDDARFLQRFRAEAKAAAQLSHPNLLAVYDWGEHPTPYLVTELLLGGSLLDLLERTPQLSRSQGLLVALQVAQGLNYAHDLGIVHRDIKPANLLFGEDGRLRIGDFGIAQAMAEAAWTEPEGVLVGTARYAAPEQALGDGIDGKTDVYSLALTVIEAVTGRVPLLRENALATMVLRQDRDVVDLTGLGPLGVALVPAGRADPSARPSAAELIDSLTEAARSLPRPVRLPLAKPGHDLFEPMATVEARAIRGELDPERRTGADRRSDVRARAGADDELAVDERLGISAFVTPEAKIGSTTGIRPEYGRPVRAGAGTGDLEPTGEYRIEDESDGRPGDESPDQFDEETDRQVDLESGGRFGDEPDSEFAHEPDHESAPEPEQPDAEPDDEFDAEPNGEFDDDPVVDLRPMMASASNAWPDDPLSSIPLSVPEPHEPLSAEIESRTFLSDERPDATEIRPGRLGAFSGDESVFDMDTVRPTELSGQADPRPAHDPTPDPIADIDPDADAEFALELDLRQEVDLHQDPSADLHSQPESETRSEPAQEAETEAELEVATAEAEGLDDATVRAPSRALRGLAAPDADRPPIGRGVFGSGGPEGGRPLFASVPMAKIDTNSIDLNMTPGDLDPGDDGSEPSDGLVIIEDDDELYRPPPARSRSRWLAPLIALIAAAAAAAIVTWAVVDQGVLTAEPAPATTIPTSLEVGDYLGLGVSDVLEQIGSTGWELKISERRVDNTESGEIIAQRPRAGTELASGSTLEVDVSLGPELRSVPDLDGLTLDGAASVLRTASFTVGVITEQHDDDIVEGTVMTMLVEGVEIKTGDEFESGTPVDLVVSSGPLADPMPSFVGLSLEAALAQAEDLGLVVTRGEAFTEVYDEGFIVDTTPPTSTPVTAGDPLTLVVSLGPPFVTVPDVVGLDPAAAADVLSEAGLSVTDTQGPPNQPVTATDPAAGQSLRKGASVVVLTVTESGPESEPEPQPVSEPVEE